jgi:hypothetical protein
MINYNVSPSLTSNNGDVVTILALMKFLLWSQIHMSMSILLFINKYGINIELQHSDMWFSPPSTVGKKSTAIIDITEKYGVSLLEKTKTETSFFFN